MNSKRSVKPFQRFHDSPENHKNYLGYEAQAVVQELVGHDAEQMSALYTHVGREALERVEDPILIFYQPDTAAGVIVIKRFWHGARGAPPT